MTRRRHLDWQPFGVDGDGCSSEGQALGLDEVRRVLAEADPRGLPHDLETDDLGAAGWGVIFAEGTPVEIRQALEPLLSLRRQQAGRLYQELTYSGEEPARFLRNLGASRARGPIDPERLPYYLLLVGDPEQISFELQFALDLQRAVGRAHFTDPQAGTRWARRVVASEKDSAKPGLAVFAPQNDDDPLTASSAFNLARPLAKSFASRTGWSVDQALSTAATKLRLASLLSENTSSLIFSAGHAVRFRAGHPRQRKEQGALVCADWPGPKRWRGPLPSQLLFGASDLPQQLGLESRIAFCYACYSIGTPYRDLYVRPTRRASVLAPKPFLSRLSQALLSHPGGGVTALVGYVDQTFESSFLWPTDEGRVSTFIDTFLALAHGKRLGSALECFAQRYAELATEIAEHLWKVPEADMSDDQLREIGKLWHAFQDARSFGVLGDPAARLNVNGEAIPQTP